MATASVIVRPNSPSLGPKEIASAAGTTFLGPDNDGLFPPPTYEEDYISSPTSEGSYRSRSAPQNPIGNGQVYISEPVRSDLFRDACQEWERYMDAFRLYGGRITYTTPDSATITYEVESLTPGDAPQNAVRMAQRIAEYQFTVNYRPYGLLPLETPVPEFTANGNDPIIAFEVPELAGSAEALGMLTLGDAATQNRLYVEGGLETRYYDPVSPQPLLVDDGDMSVPSGATGGFVHAGAYGGTTIRRAETSWGTGQVLAGYAGAHVGRFHVKVGLIASNVDAQLRLGTQIRGGGIYLWPWRNVKSLQEQELDLATVNFPPPAIESQAVQLFVYGKAPDGTSIEIDYLKFVPAERYFKAKGQVGGVATLRANRYLKWQYNGVFTETSANVWADHPTGIGSYLRIPRRGGRMAVAAFRGQADDDARGSLGDDLSVQLDVIPRVLLRGA